MTPGILDQQKQLKQLEELYDDSAPTSVHRIVLGQSQRSLQEEVEFHPELVNQVDCYGRSPLWWAVIRDDTQAARILLQAGANGSLQNNDKQNVLHACTETGNVDMAKLLLSKLDEVGEAKNALRTVNLWGNQPHHDLLDRHACEVLDLYIRYGCDLNARNASGNNALIRVMYCGGVNAAKALKIPRISEVDPEAKGRDGWTAEQVLLRRFRHLQGIHDNMANLPPQAEHEVNDLDTYTDAREYPDTDQGTVDEESTEKNDELDDEESEKRERDLADKEALWDLLQYVRKLRQQRSLKGPPN